MSQKSRVFEILKDHQPHSTFEIMETLYPSGKAGLFRLGAIIFDIKKEGQGIKSWKDKEIHNMHWYQLERPPFQDLFGAGSATAGAYSR